MTDAEIETAARAAHEANRAWCLHHGDTSQPAWDDAPEWQRTSALNGVRGVEAGNSPQQSHEGWLREKVAAGWVYGTLKDPDAKTHPCIKPYNALPPEQRAKDLIYVRVVAAFLTAFASSGG